MCALGKSIREASYCCSCMAELFRARSTKPPLQFLHCKIDRASLLCFQSECSVTFFHKWKDCVIVHFYERRKIVPNHLMMMMMICIHARARMCR